MASLRSGRPAILRVAALTADAFRPFGTVVEAPVGDPGGRSINEGSSERFELVDDLELASRDGRPSLALFRAAARRFPHAVRELERHSLGSQTFLPLGTHRFVVVVAPPGAGPTEDAILAFVTDGRQGIVLAPGVWHHALLAVEGGDFAVIERAAAAPDCDVFRLDGALEIGLP